jgi:hypothetical protein
MARKLSIPLSAALAGTLIAASPAAASTVTDCANLQSALDNDAESVVTLAQGLSCTGSWNLPSGRSITLEGAGTGATLRGDGESRILEGFDHGTVVVRNLTFTNGSTSGDGGAIHLSGLAPVTIAGSTFTGNSARGSGGAVRIEEETPRLERSGARAAAGDAVERVTISDSTFGGDEGDGNDAGRTGGALSVEVPGNVTLAGNAFNGNHGYAQGGGANVLFCGAATVTGNTFEGNEVDSLMLAARTASGLFGGHAEGGGLAISGADCFLQQPTDRSALEAPPVQSAVEQTGNVFRSNVVDTDPEGSGNGGGEIVRGAELTSTDDTFHANAIAPGTGGSGGGLAYYNGDGATLRNFVATANTMSFGEGGGVAFDAFTGSALSIVHATIAGNSVGEGQGSGVWGARGQSLTLDNSIVHGNTGGEELTGFENAEDGRAAAGVVVTGIEVAFSDACDAGGAPLPGEGNICADPKLAGAAGGNVHQTAASPTLDKASQAHSGGLTKDFEGQARAIGYRSATAVPDMGADEAPAPPATTPVTQQPAAPAGGVLGEQAKSCTSRRSFKIKLRNRGQKVVKATVIVNGKRVQVLKGKRLTSRVNLRGLPKGRYSVRIKLELADGRTISGVRRYYTCRPGRKSGPPKV